MRALRDACAAVADRARSVRIETARIPAYAALLPLPSAGGGGAADTAARAARRAVPRAATAREATAAFWLTLDAINFGSGWFPTLRKRAGASGYTTIATGLRERFEAHGPWTAQELTTLTAADLGAVLGQDPGHELIALFAGSLNDLGRRVAAEAGGSFARLIDEADGSAVALATRLGSWDCFADCSRYEELTIPFLKRAQIAAADLARSGVARFGDLAALTMFADNLVPHVLRLDGILTFEPELVARIEREELLEHGSAEEVEIRACALHAVELIVAARGATTAAEVDQLLWERGGDPELQGPAAAPLPLYGLLSARALPSASARAEAIASAPASPTSSSGRMVPLSTRSIAGNLPALVSARSSAITVVSPPIGAAAVAITVSEPLSTRLRAAAITLRAAWGCSPSSESISTTAWAPRAATRRAWSTTSSTALACASAEYPMLTDAAGAIEPWLHSPISSGRTPASASVTWSSSRPASVPASRRSASVLPAREGPTIVTRDPRPNGVSHSIALSVGSSDPSLIRSDGNAAGRSS